MLFCGYFLKKKRQWLAQREDALTEGNLHLARERARLEEDRAEDQLAKKKLVLLKRQLKEEKKKLEQEKTKLEADKSQFANDMEVERELMDNARKAHVEWMKKLTLESGKERRKLERIKKEQGDAGGCTEELSD